MVKRCAVVPLAACAFVVGACTPPAPPMDVSVTAYCIDGTTKSGTPTREGIVAADPRVIPLGSVIEIEGLAEEHEDYNGRYRVTDTGSAIKGQRIDIYMDDCRAAREFGRQDAQWRLVERGGEERSES